MASSISLFLEHVSGSSEQEIVLKFLLFCSVNRPLETSGQVLGWQHQQSMAELLFQCRGDPLLMSLKFNFFFSLEISVMIPIATRSLKLTVLQHLIPAVRLCFIRLNSLSKCYQLALLQPSGIAAL